MKYFSTFSGIGGFELGIQLAYEQINSGLGDKRRQDIRLQGGQETVNSAGTYLPLPSHSLSDLGHGTRTKDYLECVGYSEIDKYATQIYSKHFPNHINYGDITKIVADELPDFDLLVGGFPCQAFSIAGKRRGFEDTRGTMFFELARILRAKQPRLFVFENVKGLLSHDNGNTFRTIIAAVTELGYDCEWQVLNSKNHGVPQNRERVFIIGHLRGTPRPEVFPFGGIDKVGDEQNQNANTLTANYWKGAAGGRPIPTDGTRIRRLTPTECERLQGFPDGWTEGVSDTQRYKCLGNAVTVNVIKDIFEKII